MIPKTLIAIFSLAIFGLLVYAVIQANKDNKEIDELRKRNDDLKPK